MRIRRILLVSVLVVLVSTRAASFDIQAVANEAARSVVALMESPEADWAFCSGFVIDTEKGLVVTADHCLKYGPTVFYVDGQPAEEIFHIPEQDLALLKTTTQKPRIDPTRFPIEPGLEVVGLGYADGQFPVRAIRNVVEMLGVEDGTWTKMALPAVVPGMSGGPWVAADGGVAGIIQFTQTAPPDENGNRARLFDVNKNRDDILAFIASSGAFN